MTYCVESMGACRDVRCDICPNRLTIIPPADKADPVHNPKHYSRWAMEPVEFIFKNDLPAWLANVLKYCMRFDAKDGLRDLYKARSYLDMKIRQLEGVPDYWLAPVATERSLNAPKKEA